ncbi:protein mono-ADP-ribosyltransferase PARP3-like [Penaeus japonicus]|uniref:protein mono-ADP-ribosyltransferase PARP3-like n=1 Tax=Penaeus japonicus TaxID=27405 RepID=UPI001C70B19F|nr:protein mono-ADP-ribosyltransferase PARP3-like [Penaeus japonicus]
MLYKTEKEGTKFCLLQVACFKEKYVFFMRSGLKGEDGKWHAAREPNMKEAMKSFKKMFREKTGVGWNNRDSFEAQPGKYILAEKDEDEDDNEEVSDDEGGHSAEEEEIQPLDERTELMVKLILDRDMFLDQLAVLKLDTNKVTLEKLNEKMFDKAEEIFSEIEKAIKFRKPPSVLRELWTKFYHTVSHQDQERGTCPQQAIDTPEVHLFKKKELMTILSDTRLTWNTLEEVGHMNLEEQFHQLGCKLRLLEKDSDEYKVRIGIV